MELVNCCLELRIFLNIILEYLLVLSFYSYREVSCPCVPVSLRLRRNEEFYEFPCCTELFRIIVIQCPERCTTDGNTALDLIFGKYAVPTSNFPFTS